MLSLLGAEPSKRGPDEPSEIRGLTHRIATTQNARLGWNKSSVSLLWRKNREELMDDLTRCPRCGKRMVPVVTLSGRTDLQCISCDDPAVKWADSPFTALEKPIVLERV